MQMREIEIYALEGLVDSGWMLLDGWRYRALKRRKAVPHSGISVDSTQSDAASLCYVLPSVKRHITP